MFMNYDADISGSNIFGGKAHGTKKIRDYITGQYAVYTIPPKENCAGPWYCYFQIYKEQHLVNFSIN